MFYEKKFKLLVTINVLVFIVIVVFMLVSVSCSENVIFHKGSKVTFYPDSSSEYFGYTVVLSGSNVLVGAPKATSRVKKSIATGLVFSCRLTKLNKRNSTCSPLEIDDGGRSASVRRVFPIRDFFRDDTWFGATIAAFPDSKFMVCAPRWADPYKDKHLLANGACYVETKRRGTILTPLKDNMNLAFRTDGKRREYGEYGTNLNFYAYGQAGMSIKVTENNSIIIGAPGLMQWTGGIIDYRYNPDPNSVYMLKQPITNPYFTRDLGPDDYFGYSVESGIFEKNGSTLYVAGAPRSKLGYGQVLIFKPAVADLDPLNIRAKVRGPQLGSYFGASLCCADINGDGRSDLMVGAPNYVKKDGGLPYDQGAVFVYLAVEEKTNLVLKSAGYISGSGESGARFGTSIADLGDIDGDGFKDVAVGAPWENNGIGVVYIYRGSTTGLKTQYVQRIFAEGAQGFGISISKGLDVDFNNCNDLAIGAHKSSTAYIYRSIPTMEVKAVIKVPNAMNLPQNATNFTALFCVQSAIRNSWPHVKLDLKATITIDPEGNRAMITGDSEYTLNIKPGSNNCDEQIVEVKPTADLSKPISIKFDLEPNEQITDNSTTFPQEAVRLSDDSDLNSSFLIQLVRDCGNDLICTPWLVMTLEPLNDKYVPGTEDKLGVKLAVFNKEEPAYGALVHLKLPLPPKRVPSSCSLEGLNMTCDVTAPLERGHLIEWEIELEYQQKVTVEKMFVVEAKLEDVLYSRNISDEVVKEVAIAVVPTANFTISGVALPNASIAVTREKFYESGVVYFIHSFEIANLGPSDWPHLEFRIEIPENVSLSNAIKGCNETAGLLINCSWSIPAKVSSSLVLQLKYDVKKYGLELEEQTTFNSTTTIHLFLEEPKVSTIKTMLVLEPATPIWPIIVGSVAGLLLLAAIVYGLYKYGFFSRRRRDELKKLQEESEQISPTEPNCSTTPSIDANDSSVELLTEDSD